MGLFDKLISRKSQDGKSSSTNLVKRNHETLPHDQSSIERAIAERRANISLDKCIRIGVSDVAALGSAFSQFIPSLRTVKTTGIGYIPVNMAATDVLKTAGKGLFYGAHVTEGGASIMTKFAKLGTTSTVSPINPAMIMMAAMLISIEKKLDIIQNTQVKILSFLEQDKQAEQKGNLNVLTDILKGYKQNWDNATYLQNQHMKVLDIKQVSEKNILFYQEQIASAINKLPVIYLDQTVRGAVSDFTKLLSQYRMAVYLFSFSAFLEVMLLGNFHQEYLNQVAAKVQQYNEYYQEQFSKCREMIKRFTVDSLETKVVSGIGNASKALGKLIASAPVLSNGPVDEWLEDSGKKLLQGNEEKTMRILSMLATEENIGSETFVDSIRYVDLVSNQTKDILFDENTLYLAVS